MIAPVSAPVPPTGTFPKRYLALLADAGWRVAFHAGPYAITAGIASELAGRLRAPFLWKLPLFAVVLALLLVGVLLGSHVAAQRRDTRAGRAPVGLRSHLAMTPRIMREALVLFALIGLVALAAVGTMDLARIVLDPLAERMWPWTALRLVGTAAAVMISFVMLAAGVALGAWKAGAPGGLEAAIRLLYREASPALGVISLMIVTGTAATILGFLAAQWLGLWPPPLVEAAGKGLGFLMAIVILAVGAALFGDDE